MEDEDTENVVKKERIEKMIEMPLIETICAKTVWTGMGEKAKETSDSVKVKVDK